MLLALVSDLHDKPHGERPNTTERRVRVDAARTGTTLAALVREELEGLPWNQARQLCRRGKVRINGAAETDGSRRLRAGDEVVLAPHAPRRHAHVLADAAVIYVDAEVVVVNKPAGLLSVAFEDGDKNTLVDQLRFWLRRESRGQGAELGVVQRLDKDTTGLLVFARTLRSKRVLQHQLRVHSIERRYRALVHGALESERTIDTQLVQNRGDGLRGSLGHFRKHAPAQARDAQRAITDVRPLESLDGSTLVECRLHTGRQHQIRIHLSEQGHPLIGENVYIRDYAGRRLAAPRPMLHAAVLGFVHPKTAESLRFEQEPPADFAQALEQLRRRAHS